MCTRKNIYRPITIIKSFPLQVNDISYFTIWAIEFILWAVKRRKSSTMSHLGNFLCEWLAFLLPVNYLFGEYLPQLLNHLWNWKWTCWFDTLIGCFYTVVCNVVHFCLYIHSMSCPMLYRYVHQVVVVSTFTQPLDNFHFL